MRSGVDERLDRAAPRPAPRAPRLRPLRRAAGRAHGLPDHRPLHEAPARRGRGLRDRGDDDPGPDLVRDDARRRGRAALGAAPRRGRAPVPLLDRVARDGERRQQLGRGRSARTAAERFDVDFQPVERERIDDALRFSREVLEAAGATQVCWTGLASTHVQGSCRMGDDPGAVGRRPATASRTT